MSPEQMIEELEADIRVCTQVIAALRQECAGTDAPGTVQSSIRSIFVEIVREVEEIRKTLQILKDGTPGAVDK